MPQEQPDSPLLEPGDFVRLKQAYFPPVDQFNVGLTVTVKNLLWSLDPEIREKYDEPAKVPLPLYQGKEPYRNLMKFTHGIIADVVSRYRRFPRADPFDEDGVSMQGGTAPPRNVALFLLNPETGLMYLQDHPLERGAPMFVDDHVANLILVHKAEENWGNEYQLDYAEFYAEHGQEEPARIDPSGDDDG